MLWVETSTPDMEEAREFADAIHTKFPGKLLAYNCSPSFNWKRKLSDAQIASFQKVPSATSLFILFLYVQARYMQTKMHPFSPCRA